MALRPTKGDETHVGQVGNSWEPADRLPIGPGEPCSPGQMSRNDFQQSGYSTRPDMWLGRADDLLDCRAIISKVITITGNMNTL